jgi:hypothetical protein
LAVSFERRCKALSAGREARVTRSRNSTDLPVEEHALAQSGNLSPLHAQIFASGHIHDRHVAGELLFSTLGNYAALSRGFRLMALPTDAVNGPSSLPDSSSCPSPRQLNDVRECGR